MNESKYANSQRSAIAGTRYLVVYEFTQNATDMMKLRIESVETLHHPPGHSSSAVVFKHAHASRNISAHRHHHHPRNRRRAPGKNPIPHALLIYILLYKQTQLSLDVLRYRDAELSVQTVSTRERDQRPSPSQKTTKAATTPTAELQTPYE